MDASGVWFARAVGLWMVSVTLSPWTVGMNKVKLAKVYLPINLGLMGLFAQAAFSLDTTGPGKNAVLPINMWYTQLPIAAAFLGMNFLALSESDDDKKSEDDNRTSNDRNDRNDKKESDKKIKVIS